LGKIQQLEPPRVFISHAWEDKDLVRRLEKALSDAGAEVWVDHAGIRGGDNLPERINDALAWCNTLLLIWTNAAASSHWVKLEWTNAISLRKLIIPCPINGMPVPPILANTVYVDFSDEKKGVRELLQALRLAQASHEEPDSKLAGVIHARLIQTVPPVIPKPPQDEPAVMPRTCKPPVVKPAIIQLRHTPANPLSVDAVNQMLRDRDFFDQYDNKSGKGIQHHYESVEPQGAKLVLDHATSLTWQQGGSEKDFSFNDAEAYIGQLNAKNYGGYKDWRLPTLEEAMSLMEPKKHGELYLDPVFDRREWWIWTADKESAGRAWFVSFLSGPCYLNDFGSGYCVRAVRS